MRRISTECGVELAALTPQAVKRSLRYFPVPDDQHWRISLLLELLDARDKKIMIENLTAEEIVNIIEEVCIT